MIASESSRHRAALHDERQASSLLRCARPLKPRSLSAAASSAPLSAASVGMSPPARVSVSTLTPGETSVATVVLGRSSSGSDGAADGGGARGGGDDSTAEADASDGPAVNVISAIRRRATTSLACAAPRCMSHAFCSSIVRAFSSAMRVPGCRLAGASMMCARGWCRLWFSACGPLASNLKHKLLPKLDAPVPCRHTVEGAEP